MFQPGCSVGKNDRTDSRINRFALFLSTALPTERPALTPIKVRSPSAGSTTNTTNGWAYDFPKRLTRLKSVDRVSRKLRFTHAS
jgi:hypothetical protein